MWEYSRRSDFEQTRENETEGERATDSERARELAIRNRVLDGVDVVQHRQFGLQSHFS